MTLIRNCGISFKEQKCSFFMYLNISERLEIKDCVDGSVELVYKNCSALKGSKLVNILWK